MAVRPRLKSLASLDFAEGAITAVTDDADDRCDSVFGGPRRSRATLVRSLFIAGYGRRYLIDATAHHLGDELSNATPVLDPPEPEGGVLERTIELPRDFRRPVVAGRRRRAASSAKRATSTILSE